MTTAYTTQRRTVKMIASTTRKTFTDSLTVPINSLTQDFNGNDFCLLTSNAVTSPTQVGSSVMFLHIFDE